VNTSYFRNKLQWKDILKKVFVVITGGAKPKLFVEIYLRK